MKSLFRGSAAIAATILSSSFLLSARSSVAETLLSSLQKPKQELSQGLPDSTGVDVAAPVTPLIDLASEVTAVSVVKNEKAPANPVGVAQTVKTPTLAAIALKPVGALFTASKSEAMPASPGVTYTATAYSLYGRTANGMRVNKGLIAADPRVLPLGTRVRLDAGTYSGDYLVADTGGAVHGKRIDIWTPNSHEANRFGRRMVRLTVLSYPVKRAILRHRKR